MLVKKTLREGNMVKVCSPTKMDPSMMENGSKIKDMAKGFIKILMVRHTLANGKMILKMDQDL